MPKTKQQKQSIVTTLADKLGRAKSVLFIGFTKLTIKDTDTLKKAAREVNADYTVAKKTLIEVALKDKPIEGMPDATTLPGNVALLMSYGDEVSGAKVAAKFGKGREGFSFLGGILESRFIDASSAKALSAIPSRLELLSRLVGSLQSPISGFVNVGAGVLRNFVGVLNAVAKRNS